MRLLRKLALPVALIYGLVIRIRNFCYDTGIFSSMRYATPTIGVGNLSVGGTGKTPMVELLVDVLSGTHRLAVLSRGYRRKSSGFLLADQNSTVREIGDEPFQIHLKFPDIAVAVDANRRRGITLLEKHVKPDLIILDDAFQHRKVRPELMLLLTTYGNLYCDDFYLPTGNLRDSKREARRADLIIVTKCPADLSEEKKQKVLSKIRPGTHQRVLFSTLEYDHQLKGRGKPLYLPELKQRPFLLVTGIARAELLVNHLRGMELEFEHLNFRDHHQFTASELQGFDTSPLVIMTEKDYMRINQPGTNLYYLGVRHRFLGRDFEVLEECIKGL